MRSGRAQVALSCILLLGCGGNLRLDGSSGGAGFLDAGEASGDGSAGGGSAADSGTGPGKDGSAESEGGVDCGAQGAGPVVLAAHQSVGGRLAVNGDGVYWLTASGSSASDVMAVSLCGGAPSVLASGSGQGRDIAADDTSVYWTEQVYACHGDAGDCIASGNVMRVPARGGTPTTLAAPHAYPWGIAIDRANAYWVDDSRAIMKVSLAGGAPTTLATGEGFDSALAVDGSSAYWTSLSSSASNPGTVQKVPLDGGTVTVLSSGRDTPVGVAVSSTNVYWQEGARSFGPQPILHALMSVPTAGGAPATVEQGPLSGFVVDAANVYWARSATAAGNYVDGAIVKAPLGGGSATTLVSGLSSPGAIAVDATSVYWVESECVSDAGAPCALGRVTKLTPK